MYSKETIAKRLPALGRMVLAIVLAFSLAITAPMSAIAAEGNGSQAKVPSLVAAQADVTAGSTASAAEPVVSKATVKARAKVQNVGWKGWVASGKTVGTTTKKGLRGFVLKLAGLGKGLKGHINYRTYDMGKGWGSAVADGKSSGRTSRAVQAVKIWLTGDVSKHYDVLYRVFVKGKGWQPWIKNKAKAGITKKGVYASAIQVKLSPKTEEAAGLSTSTVGVRYETRIKKAGWQSWTGDGKLAGNIKKLLAIDGIVLKLDTGKLTGGIQYRANIEGEGWGQGWKNSSQTAGIKGDQMEALQIKLTGNIAKLYDVYYCAYVRGYGWLDWAKNGETSGSTGKGLALSGVRVKLAKKGAAAPKSLATGAWKKTVNTRATTANQASSTLNGIDISSWQAGIDIKNVDADFVIVKATGGTRYDNPYFAQMANATLKSGKLLGAYHFACEASCPGSAKVEADHFVKVVGPYVGRAVLVLDWEADALLRGTKWAKTFLDRVYSNTGVRPLIYMSKSPTNTSNWSSVAKDYKLWVAQYANMVKTGYQTNPWTDSTGYGAWKAPTIFQYSSTGRVSGYKGDLDLNVFYGKAADWKALAKSDKKK